MEWNGMEGRKQQRRGKVDKKSSAAFIITFVFLQNSPTLWIAN